MTASSAPAFPGRTPWIVTRRVVLTVAAHALIVAAAWGQDPTATPARQVTVPVTDGVSLSADLYLPAGDGRFPTIVVRSPYGGSQLARVGERFAAAGYAAVIQDVRGMGNSGGEFSPFTYEQQDGAASLDWIVQQSWSDGTVGIWGVSYLAYAGYMMLASRHPAIRAFVSSSGWAEVDPFLTRGGTFRLMAQLTWFMVYAGGFPLPPAEARWQVMNQIYRTTPLMSFFEGAEEQAADFQGLSHAYDVAVPTLHVTGWHDYINRNSVDAFYKMAQASGHAAPQHLLIGPWSHNQELNGGSVVGDEDFGPQAESTLESFLDLSIRWFDRWVKGIDNGVSAESPVRFFLMGSNEWVTAEVWPPADVTYQPWYLSSDRGANTSTGDGRLSLVHPNRPAADTAASFDTFVYDPNEPVPTLGGANLHFFPEVLGPRDRRAIEAREDVLVYVSTPLERSLEIVGPLKAVVYASTEGVDTDFTATFVIVRPDGYARIVEDGIVRGRFREARDEPAFLEPDRIYQFTIDLGATAIVVESGSRLLLEISSSNFPKYDRNPNTAVDPFEAVEFVPVRQKVYFDRAHPSHLLLPVRQGRR